MIVPLVHPLGKAIEKSEALNDVSNLTEIVLTSFKASRGSMIGGSSFGFTFEGACAGLLRHLR